MLLLLLDISHGYKLIGSRCVGRKLGYVGWSGMAVGVGRPLEKEATDGSGPFWNAQAADLWKFNKSVWFVCCATWSAKSKFLTCGGSAGWSGGILPGITEVFCSGSHWLALEELVSLLLSVRIKDSIENPFEFLTFEFIGFIF